MKSEGLYGHEVCLGVYCLTGHGLLDVLIVTRWVDVDRLAASMIPVVESPISGTGRRKGFKVDSIDQGVNIYYDLVHRYGVEMVMYVW